MDNILINKSGTYQFDLSNNNILIKIESNLNVVINSYYSGIDNCSLSVDVSDNSKVHYYSYNFASLNRNLEVNIGENSFLETYFLELGGNNSSSSLININGYNSELAYNLVAYEDKNISSNHTIKVNHLNKKTTSNINNYAVLDDFAHFFIDVTSFIKKGCSGSNTYQHSKAVSLSPTATSNIDPILLIDEFDVQGGHRCNVWNN